MVPPAVQYLGVPTEMEISPHVYVDIPDDISVDFFLFSPKAKGGCPLSRFKGTNNSEPWLPELSTIRTI